MPERFGSNESTFDALRGQTLNLPINGSAAGAGAADSTYLRLDATNDPITGALDVKVDSADALRVLTSGSAEVFVADTLANLIMGRLNEVWVQETKYLVVDAAGLGDYTTIQAALDYIMALAGGQVYTILIRDGTYAEVLTQSGLVGAQRTITLVGLGKEAILAPGLSAAQNVINVGAYTTLNCINIKILPTGSSTGVIASIASGVSAGFERCLIEPLAAMKLANGGSSTANFYRCTLGQAGRTYTNGMAATSGVSSNLNLYYCDILGTAANSKGLVSSETYPNTRLYYCKITNGGGALSYDIVQNGGATVTVGRCLYNRTKTSGTITVLNGDIPALTTTDLPATTVTGTGTTDRVAKFTGASTIGDSNLIGAGAGTLTLSAANTHTATFPATGNDTVAMLGVANVFTANNTFDTNTLFVDAANHRVGVGTVTPSNLLTIKGTASTDLPTYSVEFLPDTGWTSTNWTGDRVNGWSHTTGNTSVLSQSKAASIGTKYIISWTVTNRLAGSFTVSFGGIAADPALGSGSYSPQATSTAGLTITPTSVFDGTIVISIKSITATTAALMALKSSDNVTQLEIRSGNIPSNIFVGLNAGYYNTTGNTNLAFGVNALANTTSGYLNVAIGANALISNVTGFSLVGIGASSLYNCLSAFSNVAIGPYTLYTLTTGYNNIAIGDGACYSINATRNIGIGVNALRNSTGNYNIGIGDTAGRTITSGTSNTFIGSTSGYHASQLATATNSTAIGADTYTTASNQIILGSAAVTTTGLGTFSPAARLHIVSPSTAAGVGALLTIDAAGSGANSDGGQVLLSGKSSTTAATSMGALKWLWVDATHASRKAKLQLTAFDTAERTGLEIAADGSLPTINILGSTVGNEAGDTTTDLRWETDTEANALFVDASADKVYIGGTTNGIEIEKGGKFKAIGTATWFDDVRVEPTVRSSGSKAPNYTAWTPSGGSASGLYFYLFDNAIAANEKEVNFKLQMPHGKLLGSAIHLHVHWMPTSTGSAGQKVRWGLEYSKANPNGVFAAPGAFIYATDPVSPPSTTPTQDTHYITEFADIDMTGDALSTILLCRLFRNSSDAADTFAGDVGLLYIDCHIEFSQLGSNEEYTQ